MTRNKIKLLIISMAFIMGLTVFQFIKRPAPEKESKATAIGLRGTTKVTQDLNSLQEERFDKHFLSAPPTMGVARRTNSNNPNQQLNRLNDINKFNHQ